MGDGQVRILPVMGEGTPASKMVFAALLGRHQILSVAMGQFEPDTGTEMFSAWLRRRRWLKLP